MRKAQKTKTNTIKISAPKFDQYEFVGLSWNGQKHIVVISQRLFNIDEDSWWYRTVEEGNYFFPESSFYRLDVHSKEV